MIRTRRHRLAGLTAAVALAVTAAACGGDPAGDASGPSVTLNASGATFPKAFYEEAIIDFRVLNPNVTINYAGGGSGKGRTDLQERQVDFAGSDGVVKVEDTPKYAGGEFLYFPTVSAPITVAYRLEGVDGLRLSGPTLARIFQRQVTRWDDPAIAADNPGLDLPGTAIIVARRADGSGTTENFTKFLESAAPGVWALKSGSTVEWPSDTQGAQGNAGVAGLITGANGTIGYVDYSDAVAADLTTAAVRNAAGRYVSPSLAGVSAALAAAPVADDLTYDPIDAPGESVYPIAAPTWILVYRNQPDRLKGQTVKAFLEYVLTGGQELAPDVDYAALPESLRVRALAQLDRIVIPEQ
jgi:phosphate transport system substrate-binding protein